MPDRLLTKDFKLRGSTYEIWNTADGRTLVDPVRRHVIDTDTAFDPPLTNEELLSIYDYGKGY